MLEVQKATLDVAGASRLEQIRSGMSGGTAAITGTPATQAIGPGQDAAQPAAQPAQPVAQPAERPEQ
jgi:hypothetical protein